MTGAFLAAFGAKTLSCRQSALIGPLAPPTLGEPSAFIGCMQDGPLAVASRSPLQAAGGAGGAQRSLPTGGAAKGVVRKPSAVSPDVPASTPPSTVTLTWAWAWADPARIKAPKTVAQNRSMAFPPRPLVVREDLP